MDYDELRKREPVSSGKVSVCIAEWEQNEQSDKRLTELCQFLKDQDRNYEVLLAAESPDTIAIRPGFTQTRAVRCRGGYGAGLRSCIRESTGAMVLELDSALDVKPQSLSLLFDLIDACDIVWGNTGGAPGQFTRLLLWLVYALPMKDPLGGVTLYRRSTIKTLPIQSLGRFARLELVAKSTFCTCLIDEVVIPMRSSKNVTNKDPDFWRDFRNLFSAPRFVES